MQHQKGKFRCSGLTMLHMHKRQSWSRVT